MTVTRGFVQAGEVRLETFEAGPPDGQLAVLIHGAGSSGRIWHTVQEYLAPLDALDIRVVADPV